MPTEPTPLHLSGGRRPVILRRPAAAGPIWLQVLVLAVLPLALLAVMAVVRIPRVVSAPALVVASDRVTLVSPQPGVLAEFLVARGSPVAEGQPVARLQAGELDSEVQRLESSLHSLRLQRLIHPGTLTEEILRARADLDKAQALARRYLVTATRGGLVEELHSHVGELVEVGAPIASITPADSRYDVQVIAPSALAALAEPQQPPRGTFVPAGVLRDAHPFLVQHLSPVLGPAQLRRALGPLLADALPLDGLHVLATGTLVGAPDASRPLVDMTPGTARLEVGRETLLEALFPSLARR